MSGSIVDITFSGSPDHIEIVLGICGRHHKKCIETYNISPSLTSFLSYWALEAMIPVFEAMPVDCITIQGHCLESNRDLEKNLWEIREFVERIVQRTNYVFLSNREEKSKAAANNNILFYLFEESERVKNIYDHYRNRYPNRAFIHTYPSGWNFEKRIWEETGYQFSVGDLVTLVHEKSIKKFVLINYYFFEDMLKKEDVFIPAFLKYMGVECVSIDIDSAELAPNALMLRKLYSNYFSRLSTTPLLNTYWDKLHENKSINYVPMVQHYQMKESWGALEEPYSVVILTNSRLRGVKNFLPLILFLLDNVNDEAVFTEIELWYLSLRDLILNSRAIGEGKKMSYCMIVFQILYNASQFLKYEVIDWIETDRRVLLFGDEGWEVLFPHYYQGHIGTEEIRRMYGENNHLYLLINNCFNYLDAGGPVHDAISNNLPFINRSPLVRTRLFEGMKCIEYSNKAQLNSLIDEAGTIYNLKELHETLQKYLKVMATAEDSIVENIFLDKPFPVSGGNYFRESRAHLRTLAEMKRKFMIEKKELLTEFFKIISGTGRFTYPTFRSRYSHSGYLKRIR